MRSSKPASSIMSNLKYKNKYWIEGKNQIHKRIQNIKKQRKSVFNELNDDGWNFLKK